MAIRLTKHPLETRSYLISECSKTEWFELQDWLNANAPGWSVSASILTLPKNVGAAHTFLELRYN